MFKKVVLLVTMLALFSGCGVVENKVDTVSEDIVLFDKVEGNLDVKNAGTPFYNKDLPFGFLLDISKEDDYEKYYKRIYVLLQNYSRPLNESEIQKKSVDFIENGKGINEAYEIIRFLYTKKDAIFEGLDLCGLDIDFPNDDKKSLYDTYFNPCLYTYEKAAEKTRLFKLALLKARNMIKYGLEQNKFSNDKDKAYANLMIAVSYLAQDNLYQILKIKEYASKWKELGGLNVELFDKNKNKVVTDLLTYIAYNDNTGVIELLKDGKSKGFLDIVLTRGGMYNFLNDDFYLPVTIYEREDKKFMLNSLFLSYINHEETLLNMQKLVEPDESISPLDYKMLDIQDRVYDNPIYMLELNGAVYVVEMKDGEPLKVEFRNPAYFNTNYLSPAVKHYKTSGLPYILSENGYNYIQKDFLECKNGSCKIVWNGAIKNQQPDKSKLLSLRGGIDCLNDKSENFDIICSNRESLLKAKVMQKEECNGKKDCFIKTDDSAILSVMKWVIR